MVSTLKTNAVASTLTGILASVGSMDASFHQPASALVASAQSDQPNKWSGGPWMRVSSGSNTVNSTGTDVLTGTGVTETRGLAGADRLPGHPGGRRTPGS